MNNSNLLAVEDSPADIDLLEKALDMFDNRIELIIRRNGFEALKYLEEVAAGEREAPALITLDLEMPKMNGFEVLEKLKKMAKLKQIPVVVFTMSGAREDIDRSYQLGANCCITKPLGFEEFFEIMKALNNFWFG